MAPNEVREAIEAGAGEELGDGELEAASGGIDTGGCAPPFEPGPCFPQPATIDF